MFFIVGSRRTNSVLGKAMHGCMRCQQQAWFTYMRQSSWFTFFFIPIIPMGSTTRAICNSCRFEQIVPNATADMTLAQARMMGAGQQPQQPYPQQQGYPQQQQQQQQQYPQQGPYGGAYPPR